MCTRQYKQKQIYQSNNHSLNMLFFLIACRWLRYKTVIGIFYLSCWCHSPRYKRMLSAHVRVEGFPPHCPITMLLSKFGDCPLHLTYHCLGTAHNKILVTGRSLMRITLSILRDGVSFCALWCPWIFVFCAIR